MQTAPIAPGTLVRNRNTGVVGVVVWWLPEDTPSYAWVKLVIPCPVNPFCLYCTTCSRTWKIHNVIRIDRRESDDET